MTVKASFVSRVKQPLGTLAALAPLLVATSASAATIIATPGEQNTQSGENGCETEPCQPGHWLHYPELLQKTLGNTYMVMQNGDGGAVLGCDDATKQMAGGGSFCASGKYTASIVGPPNIAIIGPFGEHDQRILAGANEAMYGNQATFEGAYYGLVQKYQAANAAIKVYMMTPIDVPWGGTNNLTSGKNIVKDFMLPAALKVAADHNLKVIDTYTAMTSTQQLQTMYYGTDGQVTMAGQQKMADLIIAALMDNGAGGSGGAGAGGTAGAAGAAGSGGAAAGTGGTAAAGSAAGGAAGTATATAGTTSFAGTTTGGTGPTGTGGTGPTGTSGSATAGTAPAITSSSSSDSGGCTLSNASGSGWGAGAALLGIALALLGRKRRS